MEKNCLLKMTVLIALSAILLVSCSNNCIVASNNFAPKWLKKGAYAEYLFPSGGTNIVLSPEGDIISREELPQAVFRWECVDLNSTFAKLNITFYYKETENQDTPAKEGEQYTVDVYVNIFSRAVYLQNGTLVGTTTFWLPATPSAGGEIVLWDVPPDKVSITVSNLSQIQTRVLTPQGSQQAFRIDQHVTISGTSVFFRGLYDFDAGVLCNGILLPEFPEPTLKALELSDFGAGTINLVDTNIDLGITDSSLDLRTILTVVALAVAFVIIFVAVYRRRTKRH